MYALMACLGIQIDRFKILMLRMILVGIRQRSYQASFSNIIVRKSLNTANMKLHGDENIRNTHFTNSLLSPLAVADLYHGICLSLKFSSIYTNLFRMGEIPSFTETL
jgi:hypothetical protein